ncbi:MAG: TolC family protein [Myxococcota bacterium]
MLSKRVALSFAMLAVGCTHNFDKDEVVPPPLVVPEAYTEGQEAPPPTPEVGQIRDARWWRTMGDPTLSQLIEEALRRNQSVRAGWARVNQSKYLADQVRAARMPQVGLNGRYEMGKGIFAFGDFKTRQATGSVPVSYEIDMFARWAREHQGAKLDAKAAALDQDALAISISAEVAEAWFDAINARIEVAVVTTQLDTDLRFLELVELRYREGLNSAVDVHQQRQRVASQRALLAVSEAQIDLTDQRLSVLLGEAPGRSFPLDDRTLPDIGPTPDVEAPATLLKSRPDIRAAEHRVRAQDRRLAAALSERLGSVVVDVTPGYTWLRADGTELIEDPNNPDGPPLPVGVTNFANGFTWSMSANYIVPLFDGLLDQSVIKQQREIVQELVERYAETVITAISEVEGALVLERQERLRIQFLEDEFRLAGITLEATRDRYRAGLSDFLPVLTALATRQLSELQLIASRRQLVSYRVQLYRALGGAWPEEFGPPEESGDEPKDGQRDKG